LSGKYSKDYFNRFGELKHIQSLKYWGLKDVLHEKYSFSEEEAQHISDFLLPMLDFNPQVKLSFIIIYHYTRER